MNRCALLALTVAAAIGNLTTATAEEQFSRAAFLDAMKTAAKSESWNEVMWIPQLSGITEGKKADYVLALAYLASMECGPAVARVDESKSYLVLKADGLFTAYGYDLSNPAHIAAKRATESMGVKARTQIMFASAFQAIASQLLTKAILISQSDCDFSRGWAGSDSGQIDFLRRTCSDLRHVLYPDLNKAKSVAAAQVKSDLASAIGDAGSSGGDQEEVGRLAKLSPVELERDLSIIERKSKDLQVEKEALAPSRGKLRPSSSTLSPQDRETQVEVLNAQLESVRHIHHYE